jgi:hypothetical protein
MMKNLKTFESLNEEYKGHITTRVDFNEEDLWNSFIAGCDVDNDDPHDKLDLSKTGIVYKEFKKWLKNYLLKK